MSIKTRPLIFNDFPAWLPLWNENNAGHINEKVTSQTWQRLCDPAQSVFGFAAFDKEELVGILHYILHPVTGSINNACYMQDLFTLPSHRNKGIAKKLLQALYQEHKQQKWARIYWVAEENNAAAQQLYKSFGVKLDFTYHALI